MLVPTVAVDTGGFHFDPMEHANAPFCCHFIVASLFAITVAASAQTAAEKSSSGCARDQILPNSNERRRHGRYHLLEGTPREAERRKCAGTLAEHGQ